jgi:hypothetical protein
VDSYMGVATTPRMDVGFSRRTEVFHGSIDLQPQSCSHKIKDQSFETETSTMFRGFLCQLVPPHAEERLSLLASTS